MPAVVGVVVFPGSNCDLDVVEAVRHLGGEARLLWHGDDTIGGVDAVVLPGGFAHGDYLRPGAIARFSPVMRAVGEHAAAGGPVVGICNGFQILCEAGLLPGALIRNRHLRFVCRFVDVRVETSLSPLTEGLVPGELLRIPVKHGVGQFTARPDDLARIEAEALVTFRYCGPGGELDDEHNVNGSAGSIAGIRNPQGNVAGLMPHPEHAVDPDVGSTGGQPLFASLLAYALARV
jgi:phosphoribosylformylglycinamidine synthase